jgi:hypothetical protein
LNTKTKKVYEEINEEYARGKYSKGKNKDDLKENQ